MAYIGKTPSQATRQRYYFTATGGETSLSGADDNANTLVFTDGNYVDVTLNGVTLVAGTDYNTTTANTIGGLAALVASDIVEIIVYDTFSVFGGDVKGDFTIQNGTLTAGDATFTGTVSGINTDLVNDTTPQLGGNLDTNGNDINFGDNDKAIFGAGSDLQIYHDGSNSNITDVGTGNLNIRTDGAAMYFLKGTSEILTSMIPDGAVSLYYDGSAKLATTATGIDVTGTVTADRLVVDSAGNISSGSSSGSLTLFGGSTNQGGKIVLDGGNSDGDIVFHAEQYQASPKQRMLIANNGDISFYEDTGTTPKLFWDASAESLGIGTSSPGSILDIQQSTTSASIVRHKNTSNTSGAHSRLIIQNGGTSGGDALINLDTQEFGSRFTIGVDRSANKFVIANADKGSFDGSDEAMVIDSSGNVGIGTSSPAYGFEYANASPILQIKDSNSTGSAANPYVRMVDSSNTFLGAVGFASAAGPNFYLWQNSANPMSFLTNGTERMRIDSSGNLLVGNTTSPFGSIIHVQGTPAVNKPIFSAYSTGNSSTAGIGILNDAGSRGIWTDSGNLRFTGTRDANSTEHMRIDSGGNVGIGTSSPDFPLEVYKTGTSEVAIGTNNGGNAKLSFYESDSSTKEFFINYDGTNNTGEIGTSGQSHAIKIARDSGNVDIAANLAFNSGYGSAATAYGCRAWVNFNGTGTVAIRASGNVSSISDTGTGQYDIYFSTSMPDTNYCATTGQSQYDPPDNYDFRFPIFIRVTETTYCRVICNQVTNGLSLTDTEQALVAVFR